MVITMVLVYGNLPKNFKNLHKIFYKAIMFSLQYKQARYGIVWLCQSLVSSTHYGICTQPLLV